MKHLNELNRNRLLKLYNLLPEDLAKKELPAFYVPASFLYVDWDSINLDKYDHLFKPKSPTNKKSKLQTAIKKTLYIAGVKNLL